MRWTPERSLGEKKKTVEVLVDLALSVFSLGQWVFIRSLIQSPLQGRCLWQFQAGVGVPASRKHKHKH